ncbi:hypothetical protein N657DRAFT_682879 [Parathielavia appendiculata]|uniref:Uncharacterized protein n=1 Tax=Parathielavia appendiculata TaxID=2587402 RepID=A0AAN6Z168_9PEZI|nr:hypothetical protein N657DRAFT_682879 [Parathielavia appendiculata]
MDDVIDAAESSTAALAPYVADFLHAYSMVKGGGELDGVGAVSCIDATESSTAALAPYMAEFFQACSMVKIGEKPEATSCSPVARIFVDISKAMLGIDAENARIAFRC